MSDALHRITSLAQLLAEQLAAVDAADAALTAAKDAARRTAEEDLPALMEELGLEDVTLSDGTRVTVAQDVSASVSAERMPAAVAWLSERGYDSIVRSVVKVEFGVAERAEAQAAAEELSAALGREVALTSAINPQTLKAFVRERMAAGEAVPFDVFGIHPFSRAKLSKPRAKR